MVGSAYHWICENRCTGRGAQATVNIFRWPQAPTKLGRLARLAEVLVAVGDKMAAILKQLADKVDLIIAAAGS
jgi:hypothetical protein